MANKKTLNEAYEFLREFIPKVEKEMSKKIKKPVHGIFTIYRPKDGKGKYNLLRILSEEFEVEDVVGEILEPLEEQNLIENFPVAGSWKVALVEKKAKKVVAKKVTTKKTVVETEDEDEGEEVKKKPTTKKVAKKATKKNEKKNDPAVEKIISAAKAAARRLG